LTNFAKIISLTLGFIHHFSKNKMSLAFALVVFVSNAFAVVKTTIEAVHGKNGRRACRGILLITVPVQYGMEWRLHHRLTIVKSI
jgi:hypothetical protein